MYIAMYIANSFTYKERFDLCINIEGEFESIAVEITDKLQKQNTVVAEVYRISNTNESLSIQRYEEMVANICGNTNQVILGSDMNFDYKKVGEHKNTSDLLNVFFSQGLLPTVSRPTRITHTSATVIDNVYMKCAGYRNVNSRIIVSDISDHYAILACMGWGGSRGGGGSRGPRTPPGPQRGGPGPLFQNEENSIYYLQFYLIPPNKSL